MSLSIFKPADTKSWLFLSVLVLYGTALSSSGQADEDLIQGYSCDHELNASSVSNAKIEKRLKFALNKLAQEYEKETTPGMKARMTASVKELSDILGKMPTGTQLYQFFKQLKEIKKEYKEHREEYKEQGSPDQNVSIKEGLFRRWISMTPDRKVLVTFDDGGKMYLIFQAKPIGKGGFKVVHRAISYKDWEEVAAVSPLKETDASLKAFCQEKDFLSKLPSDEAGLICQIGSGKKKIFQKLYEGDLSKFIRKGGHLTISDELRILSKLTSAIGKIQSRGYSHNDIKLDNIFYKKTPDGRLDVALGDYGLMTKPSDLIAEGKLRTVAGTLNYMAPELILGWQGATPQEKTMNALKADVYSLGLVATSLVIGRTVLRKFDVCDTINKMKRYFQCRADQTNEVIHLLHQLHYHLAKSPGSENPQKQQLLLLISKALSVNPKSRITIDDFSKAIDEIQNGTFDAITFSAKYPIDLELNFNPEPEINPISSSPLPKLIQDQKGYSVYCY